MKCNLCQKEPVAYIVEENKDSEKHYICASCVKLFPPAWLKVSYNQPED